MDRTEVRRSWDRVSKTYAENRNPTGSDAALLGDLLDQLSGTPTDLDVGCGDGARTLANLPPDSIGLDFSRAGLDLAVETVPNSRLVQGEMTTLPVAAAA